MTFNVNIGSHGDSSHSCILIEPILRGGGAALLQYFSWHIKVLCTDGGIKSCSVSGGRNSCVVIHCWHQSRVHMTFTAMKMIWLCTLEKCA